MAGDCSSRTGWCSTTVASPANRLCASEPHGPTAAFGPLREASKSGIQRNAFGAHRRYEFVTRMAVDLLRGKEPRQFVEAGFPGSSVHLQRTQARDVAAVFQKPGDILAATAISLR